MILSYTKEVDQNFKERMVLWYGKLNHLKLQIWKDPWLNFMLCWMIFDAYLTEISQSGTDSGKLGYFYNNPNDFKTKVLTRWDSLSGYSAKLKEYSPVRDMRPNSNEQVSLVDHKDLNQTIAFIYQIRCNLFHGAKNPKNGKNT